MRVLITGGAGFIGSTVASACEDAGISLVVLDDFSTGRREFVTGRICYEGDIADGALLDTVFADHPDIGCVIHCAAKIVVTESVTHPLTYYRNNVAKTIELLDHLIRNRCTRMVFSSSASIYVPGPDYSVSETSPVDPQSPYAATKMMVERILADAATAHPLRVISLRYFNPVGADPKLRSGLQDPSPTHAVGKLIQAYHTQQPFRITGVQWPTRDGSAIRDYVHVWDLARAHVSAVQRFDQVVPTQPGYEVINLGTGQGTTVRELVAAFREVVGPDAIEVEEAGPRPGDVVGCYTKSDRGQRLLGWQAERTLRDQIRDSINWVDRRTERLGV